MNVPSDPIAPDPRLFDALAAIAAAQGGCFTRRQAITAGVSRGRIQRALAHGEWVRLQPAVFTWAGTPIGPVTRQWAAILACQDGAADRISAVSHRSAAATIGTRLFTAEHLVEVSTERATRPRLGAVQLHRVRDLDGTDVTRAYGPVTTTPVRTVIDLGASLSQRMARKLLEEWLADRKVTVPDLRAAIDRLRHRGRSGPRAIEAILDGRTLGDQVADSALEGELGELLVRHGVPVPQHHFLVDDGGVVVAELDWAYPDAMVALEVNGYGVHVQSRERWERDLDRHNAITRLGWSVLHYSQKSIRHSPRKVAREIDEHRRSRLPDPNR